MKYIIYALLFIALFSSCAPQVAEASGGYQDVPMLEVVAFPSDWEVSHKKTDVYLNPAEEPDNWVYSLYDGDLVQVNGISDDRVWANVGSYWVRFEHLQKVGQRPAEELYTDFPQEYVEEAAGAVVYVSVEMTPWTVCVEEARVYSNPGVDPNWYLYSLPSGTPVTVRELDGTRTWAMIEVANYVDFSDLCEAAVD